MVADAILSKLGHWRQGVVTRPLTVIPSRRMARDYDRHLYQARHLIENYFAKLKQYRAIATRYEKTACTILGVIHLAATVVRLA